MLAGDRSCNSTIFLPKAEYSHAQYAGEWLAGHLCVVFAMKNNENQKVEQPVQRRWLAKLDLGLEFRHSRTRMTHMQHQGPLRVQRPFYPEEDGCCHVYVLHPPGGMVMGDELYLGATLGAHAKSLLTTPSAGKLYNTERQNFVQRQTTEFFLRENSCLEWLPQETIIFNGANGELNTRVHLQGEGKFVFWDMLRLGRVAGNLPFITGRCQQNIEVFQEGRPLFIERLTLEAASDFMSAPYGLRNADTLATLVASIELSKALLEQLRLNLEQADASFKASWGVTQKPQVLLIRYLGHCAISCRKGLELAWHFLRPHLFGKAAVRPRIWNT